MADKTCDCITQRSNKYKGDMENLFKECLLQTIIANLKPLEKEYGKGFMQVDKDKAEEIGVKIGKILVSNCPAFLNAAVDQVIEKKSQSGSIRSQALAKMDSGFYQEAIALFTKIIETKQGNFEDYNSRGFCYYYNGDMYRAIADYIRAIDLNPSYAKAFSNLSLAKYRLSDLAGAMNDATHAIVLDTTLAVAYNNRGLIYYKNSQYDSAYYDFSKAVKLSPSSALYSFNSGVALSELNEDSLAIGYYNSALDLNYINADIYNRLGISLYKVNRYKEASESFTMSIVADSTNANYYENRALAFESLKSDDKALLDYNASLKFGNRDCELFINKGKILLRMGRKKEACDDFLNAEELNCEKAKDLISKNCK